MIYGWYKDSDGKYSFFNTKHDRTFGKRLVGWHWIDGYRYYFGNDGVLYQNTTTPDGSQVDKDGRYMKNSIIQHVGGKGLSLKPHMSEQAKKNSLQNQTQQAKSDNKAKKERESNHDSKQDKTYTVTFDLNDGIPSKKEMQSVKEGNYVEYLEPPYRDGYYFLAWYQEKEVQDFDNGFSFDGTPIHKDVTLYALWLDIAHDSDGDGPLDGHEMILKTDPHKTDTDGDGLTDSEEHNFTTTDPLKTHTYLDDTADAELDIDGDGLADLEEVRFGSNPIFEDYDEDYLNDKQEKEHGTNPNNKDTDSDGLIDGQEIIQRTDKKGRVFFKLHSYPNKRDSGGDGIEDKQDEKPLIPQRYTIDYLGSPKHLKSVEERLDKQIKNNLLSLDKADKPNVIGILGTQLLMNDYDTFLKERKVNTKGKFREDYWKRDWDKYRDEYCSKFNSYVKRSGSVTEKVHYFRNNLNRIPTTLQQLNSQSSNWVLLKVGSSGYHMCSTSFSETGSYNLKFISKNGRNEGVYINYYGDKNKNKGKACTEKTDPKNMGTYNFSGMYYAKGKASKEAKDHFELDMVPYYSYGNVSRNDLPNLFEQMSNSNANRYNDNYDAKNSRNKFEKQWKGIKE